MVTFLLLSGNSLNAGDIIVNERYSFAIVCAEKEQYLERTRVTSLLRNLYAGQEATVRTRHGTTDWFQIGKGVCQGCYFHPAYLAYIQSTS